MQLSILLRALLVKLVMQQFPRVGVKNRGNPSRNSADVMKPTLAHV